MADRVVGDVARPAVRTSVCVFALTVACAIVGAGFFSLTASTKLGAAPPASLPPLVDPALTVGTLPNGMRYYIKANKHPANRAMLWLAVDVGSVFEDDDQLGYAHFLEHMAFNGTRHFPGNTLIDMIEQAGMTFGADLNAYTSFDETVYQLTMPTDDSTILRQGFDVLTDWASGGILSDSAEVIGERGVVLGEWRARLPDTASQRMQRETFERIFGRGSKYVDRFPIGTVRSLEQAVSTPIQRFYRDWYRPDLMAVIVVGDIDPAVVKREIVRRFGAIPKAQSPRSFTRPILPASASTVVHVVKDRVSPLVEMEWAVPVIDGTPESAMRLRLLEQLVFPTVQRTLTKLAKQERRAFAGAALGRAPGFVRPAADHYTLRVVAPADSLTAALQAALTVVERVVQHGIPATELDMQKTAIRRSYESVADGATAISSQALAQLYTSHYLTGDEQLWSPAQALALVRKILPAITANDVAAFARQWQTAANRTVTYYQPDAPGVHAVTPHTVVTLLDSLVRTPLAATPPATVSRTGTSTTTGASLLPTLPKVGQIVREDQIPSIDATRWTLSNGAQVVFKHTDNNPDAITLRAHSVGGHSLLPDSLFYTSGRLVGMLMTASGGLKGKGHDELHRELSGTGLREFSIDLNTFDEAITVGGSPREVEMLFQLLYLQFTAPTIDTTALAEWRRTGGASLRMSGSDQLAASLGRNSRLGPPQPVNVTFMDLAQAMHVYRDRFSDASDFTFYLVGATTAAQVKPLVERYLASLPSTNRTTREAGKDFKIPLPTERQVSEVRSQSIPPEKAQTSIRFNGTLPSKPDAYVRERSRLQALSWILGRRLLTRLREQMAVTYSIGAPVQFYQTPDLRYVLSITLMTSPDDMPRSKTAIWEEIDSLREHGPTPTELAMVTTVLQRGLENARQNNAWWIDRLVTLEALQIPLEQLGATVQPPFTVSDMIAAAAQYLPKDVYTQSTALPTLEDIAKAKKAQASKAVGGKLVDTLGE